MKKEILFYLISICYLFKVSAQVTIKGTVQINNLAKSNVTVFLNNTTLGTSTNSDGKFTLEVPEGKYELIISHIGFKTINYSLDTLNYTGSLSFSLVEEQFALEEVILTANNRDKDWEYNYSVFVREFIGTSKFSQQCEILNSEVLFFYYDTNNNTLTAEATAPLHLKNEALGYEIFFNLNHFSVKNKTTKYLGFAFFKELKGRKGQKRKWQKNKSIAYQGSKIHFYKSILNNTTLEEGFLISQFARKRNDKRPSEEEFIKARKVLDSSNTKINFFKNIEEPKNAVDSALVVLKKSKLPKYVDYLYKIDVPTSEITMRSKNETYLKFKDNLRVTFLNEKEEEGYILRNIFSKTRKAKAQTSNIISITESNTRILSEGILDKPLDVIYEEYWSYEKFGDALPLDYRPLN